MKTNNLLTKIRFFSLMFASLIMVLCFSSCVESSGNYSSSDSQSVNDNGLGLDLYLIGGQSNAAGATTHKNMLKGVFDNVGYAGQTNCQFRNGQSSSDNLTTFEDFSWKVRAGFGELPERVGPEYGMAKEIDDMYEGKNKAFIFKSAAGGTPMVVNNGSYFGSWLPRSMWDEGHNPKTDPNGVGYQYYKFVENLKHVVDLLKENGYSPRIKGMVWFQGFSDVSMPEQYEIALEAFIKDIREDVAEVMEDESLLKMPIAVGMIATSMVVYDNPEVLRINEIQMRIINKFEKCEPVETSDLILVNPDGSVNGTDQYHFNYRDMEELGMRFARKIIEMNEKG